MSESGPFDVCIVGGGLVGLSVARALVDSLAGISLLVLDKECDVAAHQSGHNSGVVHSGLYYKPGSLKARLCAQGRDSIYALCQLHGIPYEKSGKLVVATRPSELTALDELERRGLANGLRGLRRVGPGEIADIEPYVTGLAALHVPEAGVADFRGIAEHHADVLKGEGARIELDAEVTAVAHGPTYVSVLVGERRFDTRVLINCAGLHSDRVATMAGLEPNVRIVPFRGEYYRLSEDAAPLIRSLIYPVPDPRFPFLGVHFTRRIDGTVEVGPNAILALGREHYRDASPDWAEVRSIIGHVGFRKLAARHWVSGVKELINSRSTWLYARQARRLLPSLRSQSLIHGGAGVRAQAVDKAGNLVDDFVIEQAGQTVHVLNAPSPGATASIAIGQHIANEVVPLLSD